MMLFNPTCEHCIEETKQILTHLKDFPNTQFILATNEMLRPYIKDFIEKTGYKNEKQVIVGLDATMCTAPLFMYGGLPQLLVYNKEKILEDILYRDVPLADIQKALSKPLIKETK